MTQEFYNLLTIFERTVADGMRRDREGKELWPRNVYQDGMVNALFQAFWRGYSYAKCELRED